MSAARSEMTVDRLLARLLELEQEHARLHQEYTRAGAQLLALQGEGRSPSGQARAGVPAAPPDERPPRG